MVGHRPKSVHLYQVADHFNFCSDIMSDHKNYCLLRVDCYACCTREQLLLLSGEEGELDHGEKWQGQNTKHSIVASAALITAAK